MWCWCLDRENAKCDFWMTKLLYFNLRVVSIWQISIFLPWQNSGLGSRLGRFSFHSTISCLRAVEHASHYLRLLSHWLFLLGVNNWFICCYLHLAQTLPWTLSASTNRCYSHKIKWSMSEVDGVNENSIHQQCWLFALSKKRHWSAVCESSNYLQYLPKLPELYCVEYCKIGLKNAIEIQLLFILMETKISKPVCHDHTLITYQKQSKYHIFLSKNPHSQTLHLPLSLSLFPAQLNHNMTSRSCKFPMRLIYSVDTQREMDVE